MVYGKDRETAGSTIDDLKVYMAGEIGKHRARTPRQVMFRFVFLSREADSLAASDSVCDLV